MNILHAIILGIVEGITEFLPISSTGHQILVSKILDIAQTDFAKSFEIIIQLGAILAVVVLYWTYLWTHKHLWPKLLVAFVPTAAVGLVLYKVIKTYLLGNSSVVLWSFLLGGIAIILFELWYQKQPAKTNDLAAVSYKQAFLIGCAQSVSVIPGVSRAAATIVGGLALGIPRRTIVEFSFLLAIPTMVAASGLDLVQSYSDLQSGNLPVLAVGFIVSFVVAMVSIKTFLKYIQHHNFISFGIYRVVAAILFWLIV